MVARLFSLGVVFGLSSLASVGLSNFSVVHAAHPAWSAYAAPSKRPQFRPWSRTPRKSVALRWRPQPEVVGSLRSRGFATGPQVVDRSTAHGVSQLGFAAHHGGARQAMLATQMQGPGVRFRPRQGAAAHARSVAIVGSNSRAGVYTTGLQSQFRPPRLKRKQTYEELQQGNASARRTAVPMMPYQMVAASGAHMYTGYRSGW